MKIVTLTINPTIDTSTVTDHVAVEKKVRCERPRHEPGGGGINVSRAIKKLGGESLAVYPYGGTNGKQFKSLLDEEGLKQLPIKIENMTREDFTVREKSSGQQYRFVMPGPVLQKEDWQKILKKIENIKDKPEYLVASGSLPEGVPDKFYADIAAYCNKNNIKFIADTSGKALKKTIEKGLFLIKPNMREMNDLLGKEFKHENELAKEVQKLIKKGATKYVVLSLGAGGVLLITANKYKHFRSPTVQIKSKVGAGDSTVAGMVLSLSRGESIETAVMYGIAAGASAVMTPGSELCTKKDTDKLFKKISGK